MAPASEKQRLFSRRAFVLGGLQLAGVSALAARLYYLQFVQAEEYKTLAENNRIKLQLIAPERGYILDRNGIDLVKNEQNHQLFLDAASMPRKSVQEAIANICSLLGLSEKHFHILLRAHKANPYGPPLLVKEHMEWEDVAKFELNQLDYPACYIQAGHIRAYPFAEYAAHLLGYVGAVSPEEVAQEDDQPLLKLPEFKIGKTGAERLLEQRLRGTAGLKQIEVDVHGRHIREIGTREGIPGDNVHLSIHAGLQEFAAKSVGEESASVVVLNVQTGEICAMVSMPGYDPNIFSKGIPTQYWKELQNHDHKPLINKTTQGQYPPGSTFKMVTGLAGLQSGAINTKTQVFCPGHFYLGSHRFNCWKEHGHGTVNIHSALAGSCDTFFYTVGQRMGIEPLTEMSRAFGFGALSGLDFTGEKEGLVPDPEWKKKRYPNDRWNPGDTINAAIGQGYVLSTPLQQAVMAARIASGKAVQVQLLKGGRGDFAPLEVQQEYLDAIRDGMDAAVNKAYGTAYGKRILNPDMAMAGKTGTAQVRKITVRGMDQNKVPWEYRHHAWFVAYAPILQPKYAICVLVEHGGGGASAAAPIARDVLQKAQELGV